MDDFLDGAKDFFVRHFPANLEEFKLLIRAKEKMHLLSMPYGKASNGKITIFILRKKRYSGHMLVLKARLWAGIRFHQIIVSILPSTARRIYAIRIKSEGSWIWYSFKINTRKAEFHHIYGARLVCV